MAKAGRDLWRSFGPAPLRRAGSIKAGGSGPCPLNFEYLHSMTSLGNLFFCLATLTVKKLSPYIYVAFSVTEKSLTPPSLLSPIRCSHAVIIIFPLLYAEHSLS